MKKSGFLLTILLILGSMISGNCFADLAALNETQMRHATAQAGIALTAADRVALDSEIGTISYCDTDGTDGTPAYLSLNDISIQGYADFKNPVSVNITTKKDAFSDIALTGIDISLDGAEIHMDHFNVGSITVGSAAGEGNSFGSISVSDFHARISGNVRITSH
jgi:hypothetical protein